MVTHPSTNRAQCRATLLIRLLMLPLRHANSRACVALAILPVTRIFVTPVLHTLDNETAISCSNRKRQVKIIQNCLETQLGESEIHAG